VKAYRYVVVDVFTDRALTGNQLAVFTDARGLDADLMQALTREIGFSETTFLVPADAGGHARIRIFNPRHEMAFAGHPILGTAWVLAQPLQRGVIELETGMGIVPIEFDRDESGALVFGRMQQPVPTIRAVDAVDVLFEALGIGGSELPV
jgi:trans-2,3-dihydro-3-hydroxyanthranilate isomerase